MWSQVSVRRISVDGEIWEHLDSIVVVNLVLDPAFGGGVTHFESSHLQPGRTAGKCVGHLTVLLGDVRTVHAWTGSGRGQKLIWTLHATKCYSRLQHLCMTGTQHDYSQSSYGQRAIVRTCTLLHYHWS